MFRIFEETLTNQLKHAYLNKENVKNLNGTNINKYHQFFLLKCL